MSRDRVQLPDVTPTVDLGSFDRVAFFGGIYSNHLALGEALKLARSRKVDAIVALGDFGAFGPHPDRTIEILREASLPAIQGNYEQALSTGAEDCLCGYTDPRDNYYAQLLRVHARAYQPRAQGVDGKPARAHPHDGRRPEAAALSRLAAEGQ